MNIEKRKIIIELEDREVEDFWNVIMFALDLDADKHSMTDEERKMAKTLANATKTER